MLLAFLTLILAIFLLVRGVRGKRIGITRHCAKCEFLLDGLPDAIALCPECGNDISLSEGIAFGVHRRSRALIVTSIALFVLGGLFASIAPRPQPLIAFLPNFVLAASTRLGPGIESIALEVLTERANQGDLSQSDISGVISRGFAHQLDVATPWRTQWGDFFSAARNAGLIDNPTWVRYVQQGVQISLRTRPRARSGQPVPATFHVSTVRCGGEATNVFYAVVDPNDAATSLAQEGQAGLTGGGISTTKLALQPKLLDDGRIEVAARYRCAIVKEPYPHPPGSGELAHWEETITATSVLVPPGESTATPMKSNAGKAHVASQLPVHVFERDRVDWIRGAEIHIKFIYYGSLPVAYRVIARTSGGDSSTERLVGAFTHIGGDGYFFSEDVVFDDPPPKFIDIIFRPDASLAEADAALTTYLDEEVVLSNIAVESKARRNK